MKNSKLSPPENSTILLRPAQVMELMREAQRRLSAHAHRTPVVTSRTLNAASGVNAYLKCENLQRVGAFKFRGAFNAISALSERQRANGVLTYSSGNHAQAMALAGQLLETSVTVVMPNNAPANKLAATRSYGAQVILYDPHSQRREDVAAQLPEAQNATLIPPFDHYDVIAGQGTAALELFETLNEQGSCVPDALFVPVGGGGLLTGSAVAAHFAAKGTRVIGVEPANADDAAQSLRTGNIVHIDFPDTIADGTRTLAVGERNFALMRELVDDIVLVSEDQIRTAVRFLFERMKLVVEPSGALGVAALLAGQARAFDHVGVILSGGNIDIDNLTGILSV